MKKSMLRKVLLLACSAVLLVCLSVGATLAYLTSQDTVTNTFTVGKVKITLDETDVDVYGVKEGNDRVNANTYKLMPGHTYVKDPVVHVDPSSEPCYIRAIVTVSNITALENAFPVADYPAFYTAEGVFLLEKLVSGWEPNNWACVKADDNGTYEFRYVGAGTDDKGVYTYTAVNKDLDALFDAVVIPTTVDNKHLGYLNNVKIDIVAHAIQADGFTDANDAWLKFTAPATSTPGT